MPPEERLTAASTEASTESSPWDESILFVCSGNVCRSPYMEIVLRHALLEAGSDAVRVSSAGTAAIEGMQVAVPLQELLQTRGVDPEQFRARQLSASMLARAGVVITAEREHRRWVTRLDPGVTTRTFTLMQVARLLGSSPTTGDAWSRGGSVQALVATLDEARGRGGAGSSDDDIDDPWGRSRRVYRRVAARIDTGLAPVVRFLSPVVEPGRAAGTS